MRKLVLHLDFRGQAAPRWAGIDASVRQCDCAMQALRLHELKT